VYNRTAQHSTAQHSTAQHSTALTNFLSFFRERLTAFILVLIFAVSFVSSAQATDKTLPGSENYTANDGDNLTGSTSGTVTIANNAKITLNGATITGGIVCEGSATITLVGENNVGVTSLADALIYKTAGIQIGGTGTTLTIKGNGSLSATGGSIVIEGGTITANGGNGIGIGNVGNSKTASIGDIVIKGGTVNASLGKGYIYNGSTATIGVIKIYDTIVKVDASKITKSVTYMHVENNNETDVTNSASTYFTIIEDGDRRVITPKDDNDYTITIAGSIEHGTIACAETTAKYGDKITITATPDFGYRLSRLDVKDADNNDVVSTGNSFFMPKSNVTVSAVFEQGTHGTTEFVWGYFGLDSFVKEATIYDGVTTVNLQTGRSYRIIKYSEHSYSKFLLDNNTYDANIPFASGTGAFVDSNGTNFEFNGESGFYNITMTDADNGKWTVSIQKTVAVMDAIPDQPYTGSAITPDPLVLAGSLSLTKGTDYEYSYTDNTNIGTAKVTVTFKGDYVSLGTAEKTFIINPGVEKKPELSASSTSLNVYKGSSASVTVTAVGVNLTWKISGDLPAGLSGNADGNKYVISGTVSSTAESKTYEITITAENPGGKDSKEFSITVSNPPATPDPGTGGGSGGGITQPEPETPETDTTPTQEQADELVNNMDETVANSQAGQAIVEALHSDNPEQQSAAVDVVNVLNNYLKPEEIAQLKPEEIQAAVTNKAEEVKDAQAELQNNRVEDTKKPAGTDIIANSSTASEALKTANENLSVQPKVVTPEAASKSEVTEISQNLATLNESQVEDKDVNFDTVKAASENMKSADDIEIETADGDLETQAEKLEEIFNEVGGNLANAENSSGGQGVVIASVLPVMSPKSTGFFPLKVNLRNLTPGRKLNFWPSVEFFNAYVAGHGAGIMSAKISLADVKLAASEGDAFFLDAEGKPVTKISGNAAEMTVVPYLEAGKNYDSAFITADATESDLDALNELAAETEKFEEANGGQGGGGGCNAGRSEEVGSRKYLISAFLLFCLALLKNLRMKKQ